MEPFVQNELWAQLVIFIPLGVYLLTAAIWDGVTAAKSDDGKGRIPNKLSYSSVLVGLACHAIIAGLGGLGSGALAVVVVFVVGIFLAALGWLGGGDVKLLMGVGAFVGLSGLGAVLFYAVFAGSALGLLRALSTGYLKDMLVRIFRFMRGLFRAVVYQTKMVSEDMETDPRSMVPFAVPILIGAVLAYTEAAYHWPGLLTWFVNSMPF